MRIARLFRRGALGRSEQRVLIVTTLAVLAGCLGAPAYASAKPTITGLAASPSQVASGGTVTVSATVSEATECTLSANKAVAGLPASFSCESGSVSHEVVMPQNTKKGKAARYKLTLSAKGSGGKTKAVAAVLVDRFEPEPLYTLANYDFAPCSGRENERKVVMSGDGTSAVWGHCTLAYDGETWVRTGELPAEGEPLAMAQDGLTLLMYYKTGIEAFTRSSETEEWVPQAKITEPSKYNVSHAAISANGNTVLVGGAIAEGRPVREYDRSGEAWAEGEAPPVGSAHCTTAALSADGQTALLDCVESGSNHYVQPFVRSGSSWAQEGPRLTGSGEQPESEFGGQLALSADGNTAVMGAAYDRNKQGEAWIFHRSGETWTQQGPPITKPEKRTEKLLGAGLALSADGDRALIGAPVDLFVPESRRSLEHHAVGVVYVYERSGEAWNFVERLQPSKETFDECGHYLALSENGEMALIARWGGLNIYSG